MPTNRDLWLKSKPAIRTDLKNKKITIPAFSYASFEQNSSLLFLTTSVFTEGNGAVLDDYRNAITIEAWIKLAQTPVVGRYVIFCTALEAAPYESQYEFGVENGVLNFRILVGGVQINAGDPSKLVPVGEWIHVAASWDGTTLNMYVNGELNYTGAAAGPADSAGGIDSFFAIGCNKRNGYQFAGNIAELRIWQIARTQTQLRDAMYVPRDIVVGDGIDDDLIIYCKCKRIAPISGGAENSLVGSGPIYVPVPIGTVQDDDNYPPLRYGASFVVAEYSVVLDQKCSIKFPIVADDPDHSLVVRYTDNNGNIQRRYFYKPTGVDYDSSITQYAGERLSEEFVLEFWNIDGNDTTSLNEDLVIYLSLTSVPSTAVDRTAESAYTPTADNAIAQNFPLTPFPLTFNSTQTYPII
jgi:hypothetical protein